MIKFIFILLISIISFSDSCCQWIKQFEYIDSLGHSRPFSDILFINENTGFATIGQKHSTGNTLIHKCIFKTTNGGNNWEAKVSGIEYLQNLCSAGNYLFAAGNLRIYISSNSGESWTNTYLPLSPQTSAFFINELTGFAGGMSSSFGRIMKTTDGGYGWNSVFIDNIPSFTESIYFINSSTGVACLSNRRILRTTDTGMNWNLVYSGKGSFQSDLFEIYFNNDTLWAVGEKFVNGSAKLIYSDDFGINWKIDSSLINIEEDFRGMQITDINNTYLAGIGGSIICSTNGGINWYSQYIPSYFNSLKILFLNESTGFIAGRDGIFKTTNGGWDIPGFPAPVFPSNNTIVLSNPVFFQWGTSFNTIFYTFQISRDTNFSALVYNDSVYSDQILISNLTPDVYYWRVRADGVIGNSVWSWTMKFNYNPTGISEVSHEIPNSYTLSQNYPNPFNPVTKIKFDIPSNVNGKTSNAKLIVYDALGKEIQTLVNEKLSPGSYEKVFNGENLPSGMYFYKLVVSSPNQLETGNFVETKRMILIK